MIVALHSIPTGFFKTDPPYNDNNLVRFIKKAATMGFKGFQIGPLNRYTINDTKRLKLVLDQLHMERNVHVGGLYDAQKFATTKQEPHRAQMEINYGVMLAKKISSSLVSFHPPFFSAKNHAKTKVSLKAKTYFLKLVDTVTDLAGGHGIKLALESFCYPPFIFQGLNDFMKFISRFPPQKLGVVLEVGHLYQAGFDLTEAVNTFKHRLLDVHMHDATLQRDFRKATHLPLGKGNIDFHSLISLLRQVKYDGWLTLEIQSNEKEIVESKKLLENLMKTI